MHDINIQANGFTKLLINLNEQKAVGQDNITPNILKELSAEISTLIYRKSRTILGKYHTYEDEQMYVPSLKMVRKLKQ